MGICQSFLSPDYSVQAPQLYENVGVQKNCLTKIINYISINAWRKLFLFAKIEFNLPGYKIMKTPNNIDKALQGRGDNEATKEILLAVDKEKLEFDAMNDILDTLMDEFKKIQEADGASFKTIMRLCHIYPPGAQNVGMPIWLTPKMAKKCSRNGMIYGGKS